MPTKTTPSTNDPGIILVITYSILFTINSLVIYLANLWFPHHVVLGTQSLSPIWALFLSMGFLSLINTFAIPFMNQYEKSRKQPLTPKDWITAYFVLNFIGLWLVTRAAEQLGLGITSWLVAAILAVILDVFQGIAMIQVEKLRLR